MRVQDLHPELLSGAVVTLPSEKLYLRAEPGPDGTISGATWLCYRVSDGDWHPLPIRVSDLAKEEWEVCLVGVP
ncbi:MAG: hypothetical protein ACYDBI_05850 [Thermoplasmataceae archaeon]